MYVLSSGILKFTVHSNILEIVFFFFLGKKFKSLGCRGIPKGLFGSTTVVTDENGNGTKSGGMLDLQTNFTKKLL
jgi:hypothetical protein